MIKWYFIKLLPVFIWILSQHLHAANEVAVDAADIDDAQTVWRPTAHHILPTADLSQLYESKDDDASNIQRRFDENLPAEVENEWQPALITADEQQQPTAGFMVSATHSFSEDDTMPAIDKRNDWKSIETDVQSPVLQVQRQFNVDRVSGDVSDRPHYEPWVQRDRERFVSSTLTTPTSSTQRFNKSYRKPFVSSRRNEDEKSNETQANDNNGRTTNLRNILKQTGGLSLSEILQQQNLSLEDLLKGKQNALKALQNTAPPPPPDPKDESDTAKTTRRLPSISQFSVVKPRRNFFNGTTRMANSNRIDFSQPTPTADDVNENSSSESSSVERRIASTIPTHLAEMPASKYVEDSSGRRVPPIRGKFIKQVVSGIRTDFDNSNLRKRKPNMKFLQSKHRTTSTVETLSSESSGNETQTDDNRAPETNEEQKVADLNVNVSTTTTAEAEVSTTTIAPKYNIRERLTLRPPRLRNVPSVQPSAILPTAIGSSEPSSSTSAPSEVTSSKVTTTSEETLPYTIITFTTQSNEPKSTVEPSEILENDDQPVDDLSKKLNESVPELNLVDLEDESKSKEVTSLEELFINDSLDPESNGNSAEMDEFIHASSTSRLDSIYKSKKPNSLKIFGGNLVNIIRKTIDKLDVTERNPGLFTDITSKFVDDKTELMDLLNDRRSGARLVKVLRQRNMTIDELLDHRKRGSSQVHLAEIFYSRDSKVTTPPTSPDQPLEKTNNVDVVTAFKNFPDFNLEHVKSVNPDEIKHDSQGSSYFTSITNIQPTAEVIKESRAIRKPFVIKLAESSTGRNIPTQLWNVDNIDASLPQSENNFLEKSAPATSLFLSKQHVLRPSTGDETNINTAFHDVVENRNDAAARSHDPLDLELSGHGYKRNNVLIENTHMPIGVRSAIVASASIVLTSLTIFMVIFLVCRWRQRRKRKICYSDRFQALRGRLPILNGGSRDISPSKRSTSPAIAYLSAASSSRRSSKLNTMDPNSPEVQEYLYDAMRKPFQ
ncbi:uncharacterized protein LOC116349081 [Contarinia nasturtii]|uniref:uncharacterized protein LOC116349081 n=1 Tax=Contarinia nasturtii TaxID=265458 RepID=UPI0012D3DE12|nr:uncharacterized protein LOC116349081 [Contarinia nasturtii]